VFLVLENRQVGADFGVDLGVVGQFVGVDGAQLAGGLALGETVIGDAIFGDHAGRQGGDLTAQVAAVWNGRARHGRSELPVRLEWRPFYTRLLRRCFRRAWDLMHIHILGICGTFMGGVALLARAAGHKVTGCDANVYPPMSTQLEEQGIGLVEGYGVEQLGLKPDVFVVGNAISRGNPLLEAILDQGLPYVSGPQWLAENVLQGRWVLAVAGTHGKTTTTSLLAWILEDAGLKPGFLVGGVPKNFGVSARLGETPFFVIEADEYDTAFCDKRSKFVHYRPRTAILNNLEFDHADIFADLAAIETQFHHLVRIVPKSGGSSPTPRRNRCSG
jgi:hypothetical protein